jgi:uncharacterized protein (DUF983 family)
VGRLYRRLYTLHEACSRCGLDFEPEGGDTWAFMYLSTGFFTGAIIIVMLLIQPNDLFLGRVGVAALAVIFIVLTLPPRKGVSIALEYLIHRNRSTTK